MAEEIKTEEKKCECGGECKCGCKAVTKFLAMTLASFFGCLTALCLFSAAVKPQMPPMPQFQPPCPMMQKMHRDFHKGFKKGDFDRFEEFEARKMDGKHFKRGPKGSHSEFRGERPQGPFGEPNSQIPNKK